jgi:hypothetical protein
MAERTTSNDGPLITDVRFDHIGLALARPTARPTPWPPTG